MDGILGREWQAHGLLCRLKLEPYAQTRDGYVRVEYGHPFYRVGRNALVLASADVARLREFQGLAVDDIAEGGLGAMVGMLALLSGNEADAGEFLRSPAAVVRVHGGLTYDGGCAPVGPERRGEWWFGWDTSHHGDYRPGSKFWKQDLLQRVAWRGPEQLAEARIYVAHVETGERSGRDFAREAELAGLRYWTADQVVAETERVAEQLALVQSLGVRRADTA